jgi:hypothetical protein
MRKALVALLLLGAAPASTQNAVPPEVQAVIDRSRDSRADYAVILRTEEVIMGQRHIRNHAEYQAGAMHRVEVPLTRLLVNCDTGTSALYMVSRHRVIDRSDRRANACGVDEYGDGPIVAARLLGTVTGPYGRADVIELTGNSFIRRYVVTEDGIIVLNDFTPRYAEIAFSLRTLGTTLRRGHPDPAMFEESSLSRAFTPAPD